MLHQLLSLVRFRNLLIIAAAQLAVWWCISHRIVAEPMLQLGTVLVLVLSTLLIAAAGYIINDYFDVKIDSINHPYKVIVENTIRKRWALGLHLSFSFAGLMLAAALAQYVGKPWLASFQLATIILLWYYSTYFKRHALVGNILVAILTALSILLVFIYEPALHPYLLQPILLAQRFNPVYLIFGIASFAFLLTWMREVVKDMEDIIGDKEQGCTTLPIVYGLATAAKMVIVLGCITMLLLGIITVLLFHYSIVAGIYIIVALIIPIAYQCYSLPRKFSAQHYARQSTLLKVIMLLGILVIFFYGK